jgi:hypothetical protein
MVQLKLQNCLHLLRRCHWDCQCLDSVVAIVYLDPQDCGGLSRAVIWWSVQGYISDFRKLGQALFGWQLGEHVWKGQKPIPQIKITLQSSPILKSKVGFSSDCVCFPCLFCLSSSYAFKWSGHMLILHKIYAFSLVFGSIMYLKSIW